MFVKFGQIASTRSDLLPEAITTELAQLQSAARPVDADAVREVLEERAGRVGGGGVRVVRLRAAGGGVDRPDAPRGAQDRRARGGEGAAARHRGRRPPRRRGAAHGRRVRRPSGRSGAPARGEAAGRGAHHLAGEGARLRRRGGERHRVPRAPRRRRRHRRAEGVPVALDPARAGDGGDPRRHRRRPRRDRGRARTGQRARASPAAVVPRPGAARRPVPRRPAPGEHLRRPARGCSGSSTSARWVGSARWCSSRCRRWRSASSSTTRSCSPRATHAPRGWRRGRRQPRARSRHRPGAHRGHRVRAASIRRR